LGFERADNARDLGGGSLELTRIADGASHQGISLPLGTLRPSCSAVGVALGLRGALDLPPVVHVAAPDGWAGLRAGMRAGFAAAASDSPPAARRVFFSGNTESGRAFSRPGCGLVCTSPPTR
jgi:hypothetical protein